MGEPFDPVIVTSIRTASGRNRSVRAARWIERGGRRRHTTVVTCERPTEPIVDSRSKAPVAALLFFI
ncbi:hypothetical protein C6T59_22795 [Burkholderia multivorans]|nr:hypothetical protein C6P74_11105 [Burkholderia multivorans]PRE84884.1 hypothetical protein C6Q02_12145 [Burkholderia multivorans]PRF06376.1 hypothetical protein C6Q01_19725 [Burkholderia multivorans]PRF90785.1 hypothetical protein C6Q23_11450 [Burkholderia multivorans]PRG62201.1 hypothetical protein C6T59_22795 [Burkholderia multivorans]